MEYIVGIIVIILIVIATIWLTKDTKILKIEKGQIFNIKNSFELTGLPLIILYQDGKKYKFLLDTGSNACYLNTSSDIKLSETIGKDTYMSADGVNKDCIVHQAILYHDKKEFNITFRVTDMTPAFDQFKSEYGVDLTGILGGDFLQEYKYVLDYAEMVVYVRKK